MKYLRDLLKNHTKLFVVYPSQTLDIAYEIMVHNHIHHLPVCAEDGNVENPTKSAGKLVGIITDRDIRLAINSPLMLHKRQDLEHDSDNQRQYKRDFEESFDDILLELEKHTVSEIMQKNVITATEDLTILEAAKKIQNVDVGAIPVVMKGTNNLTGILTRSDLTDHLIRLLEPLKQDDEGSHENKESAETKG